MNSMYSSLFLSRFNPCPDRVDSIEKSITEQLDEKSTNELIEHMESCRRCGRYYGYIEAVEKGFKEHATFATDVGPLGVKDLPSALQEEMVHSMKRNLSKWLFEMGRSTMYRQGMITPLFLHISDFFNISDIFTSIINISYSLNNIHNILTRPDSILVSSFNLFIKDSNLLNEPIKYNHLKCIFDLCVDLDRNNYDPYFYYDQLFAVKCKYNSAIDIIDKGLSLVNRIDIKLNLLCNKGRYYHFKGNVDEAICLYKESINEHYKHPIIFVNLGLAYLNKNILDDSFTYFNDAINILNSISDPHINTIYKRYLHNFIEYHYNIHHHIIEINPNLKNLFLNFRNTLL